MTWYPIQEEPLVLLCPAGPSKARDRPPSRGRTLHPHGPECLDRPDRHPFLEDRAIRTKELFEMDAPAAIVILVARDVGDHLAAGLGYHGTGRIYDPALAGRRSRLQPATRAHRPQDRARAADRHSRRCPAGCGGQHNGLGVMKTFAAMSCGPTSVILRPLGRALAGRRARPP